MRWCSLSSISCSPSADGRCCSSGGELDRLQGDKRGSAEWAGGVLFVVALVLGLAATVLDLAGTTIPMAVLDRRVGHALGSILFFAGLAGTFFAQAAMAPRGA